MICFLLMDLMGVMIYLNGALYMRAIRFVMDDLE
jgi:hypothetical protein